MTEEVMEQEAARERVCVDCGHPFKLDFGEIQFVEMMAEKVKGFTLPRRCVECRRAKREWRARQQRGF